MAKFNAIDNDFACPLICALETICTSPGRCAQQMKANTCSHPVALELDEIAKEYGLFTVLQSVRIFSSVLQEPVAVVEDTDGSTWLAAEMNGELKKLAGPLTTFDRNDTDAMTATLEQIRHLSETPGPVL